MNCDGVEIEPQYSWNRTHSRTIGPCMVISSGLVKVISIDLDSNCFIFIRELSLKAPEVSQFPALVSSVPSILLATCYYARRNECCSCSIGDPGIIDEDGTIPVINRSVWISVVIATVVRLYSDADGCLVIWRHGNKDPDSIDQQLIHGAIYKCCTSWMSRKRVNAKTCSWSNRLTWLQVARIVMPPRANHSIGVVDIG